MLYRGYFEMQITREQVRALFFGLPTILNRNPHEIPLANFTVKRDENALERPVGGGSAESGSLKDGKILLTYLTNNTETGEWFVTEHGRQVSQSSNSSSVPSFAGNTSSSNSSGH
jgi:alkaline phosphatase D